MNRDRERRRKRFRLKILLIFEAVVCYMALLNIVSHVRGPQNYVVLTDTPLVSVSDFTGFDGGGTEQGLLLENQTPGTVVGYQANLALNGLDSIYLSFSVDCPAEYAGGVLIVDLYNYESGYDSPEQEYQIVLHEGINEAAFSLSPGENAPEQGQLRLFTTDGAGYELKELQVYQEQPLPAVTGTMVTVTSILVAITTVTAFVYYWIFVKKR